MVSRVSQMLENHDRTGRGTRPILHAIWVLPLAAVLVTGCSKRQPAAGAATEGTTAPGDASAAAAPARPPERGPGPVAAPARAAVVPDSGNLDAVLGQLSTELRKYVVRTRSVPKDFEEFIAKSHVQAPPPPAGKKYAIKGQVVVLANR